MIQAQIALFAAIGLQLLTRRIGSELLPGSEFVIIFAELILALLIGLTVNLGKSSLRSLHHLFAVLLLGLLSAANISGLIFVLNSLVMNHAILNGDQLLASAVAIFMTNIIVYALWYWEIDSPGLTRTRWSKHDKDFQFTEQDMARDFPDWKPEFIDYLFLSVINSFNGATTGAKPLTHQAKMLMASQALVSVFTLALVIARSVSILGT